MIGSGNSPGLVGEAIDNDTKDAMGVESDGISSEFFEYAARAWAAELGSESAAAVEAAAAGSAPSFTETGVTVIIPDGLVEGQVLSPGVTAVRRA